MNRTRSSMLVVAFVAATHSAAAYCRSTTCKANAQGCPTDESGCVVDGTPLVWNRPMPLVFRFQRRGSATLINEEARAAVRAAFFRWTDVVCADGRRTSLRFVEGEDLDADKPLGEGPRGDPFGIYFRDLGWPYASEGGDGQIARTTVDFGLTSGAISYADIEINTTDNRFAANDTSEGIDLQTAVTHEVGHFIGLSHSAVDNSIMAPSLCESGNRCLRDRVSSRRLGDDDKAAVCAIYPPGASPPAAQKAADPAISGCNASGAGLRPEACFPAFAALLYVLGRRRRTGVSATRRARL